jgi:hypothetical protein
MVNLSVLLLQFAAGTDSVMIGFTLLLRKIDSVGGFLSNPSLPNLHNIFLEEKIS